MMLRRVLLASVLAVPFLSPSAWAMTGAEAMKRLNHDGDQTLEIPEVIDAASKVFRQINSDKDTTLERKETANRLTEADWQSVNKDNDSTLELDEWLTIARQRFDAADTDKDGTVSVKELDTPAGQALMKMIIR